MTETSARESGTPETDAAGRGWSPLHGAFCYVHEDFARKLERERDAARAALDDIAGGYITRSGTVEERAAFNTAIDKVDKAAFQKALSTFCQERAKRALETLPAAPQAEGGGK